MKIEKLLHHTTKVKITEELASSRLGRTEFKAKNSKKWMKKCLYEGNLTYFKSRCIKHLHYFLMLH